MTKRFLLFAFADNPVVWGIVVLALLCYVVEIDLILAERDAMVGGDREGARRRCGVWGVGREDDSAARGGSGGE